MIASESHCRSINQVSNLSTSRSKPMFQGFLQAALIVQITEGRERHHNDDVTAQVRCMKIRVTTKKAERGSFLLFQSVRETTIPFIEFFIRPTRQRNLFRFGSKIETDGDDTMSREL